MGIESMFCKNCKFLNWNADDADCADKSWWKISALISTICVEKNIEHFVLSGLAICVGVDDIGFYPMLLHFGALPLTKRLF